MKRHLIYTLIAGMGLLNTACSSDSDPVEGGIDDSKVEVSITTEIETKATVTTIFGSGNAINLYAKSYGRIDAPDMVENIKATFDGNRWDITPAIRLAEGEKSFLYAVAPYIEGLKDLSAIPVDISRQQDMLYSGAFVPVTFNTHTAKLTMKHALSLATFNISLQGYSGKGQLQSLSIVGEQVYTTGSMNVQSGKVTGSGTSTFTLSVNKQIGSGGWNSDLPRLWQIPFSTKAMPTMLKAVIDGTTYEARFPEVEMTSGFQYIFRLVLTAYGLEFIPDQTETISLNLDTDSMQPLNGYGVLRFTHSAAELQIPQLIGDKVFGSISWGDNRYESYDRGASHSYGTTTTKILSIESWNSTGFELRNLEGIDGIDISEY